MLGGYVSALADHDARLAALITRGVLETATDDVPDDWLIPVDGAGSPAEQRLLYVDFLTARLENRASWLPGGAHDG